MSRRSVSSANAWMNGPPPSRSRRNAAREAADGVLSASETISGAMFVPALIVNLPLVEIAP